jgi:hypothetical protein
MRGTDAYSRAVNRRLLTLFAHRGGEPPATPVGLTVQLANYLSDQSE